MIPFRGAVGVCALMVLAAGANPLQAAWCNVFQVCCNSCGGQSSASYYNAADACAPACPAPVCTTRYIARCYYQPVVSYQTKSYYEAVTTYRTSYYYEPVTSYRYSMYYDPNTCAYQQQACPQTCYRLRSQCCPVQSWVQRCCSVPVTTYQQSFYYEPVTSCCTPTCAPACAPAAPACPETPGVLDRPATPPGSPGVRDSGSGTSLYPPQDKMNRLEGSSFRQVPARAPTAPQTAPPPTVKLERIAFAPAAPGLEGQVVRADQAPHSGARLLFISADRQGGQETVQADAAGQFRLALASGDWLVYVYGPDGKPVFQKKIDVGGKAPAPVVLMSR